MRNAAGPAPGAVILILPVPPLTENAELGGDDAHGPPTSAVPSPLVTVRPKPSVAYTVGPPGAGGGG